MIMVRGWTIEDESDVIPDGYLATRPEQCDSGVYAASIGRVMMEPQDPRRRSSAVRAGRVCAFLGLVVGAVSGISALIDGDPDTAPAGFVTGAVCLVILGVTGRNRNL
jgi:hypothetical protein